MREKHSCLKWADYDKTVSLSQRWSRVAQSRTRRQMTSTLDDGFWAGSALEELGAEITAGRNLKREINRTRRITEQKEQKELEYLIELKTHLLILKKPWVIAKRYLKI